MKLLAIETATAACSAALWIAGEVRERYELAPQRHAERLLPMIGELLAEAALTPNRLDAVAFGRGPGAFTGVRIAVSCAQGIAFGADLPVVPVSTLAVLAQGAVTERGAARVFAAMDARIGEVYSAAYCAGAGALVCLCGEESLSGPAGVPVPAGDAWYGVGDAWKVYGAELAARFGPRLAGFEAERYPRARDAAVLGAHIYKYGGGVPAEQALPVYLRDRVALKPGERSQEER
jgi:tRNA threonylcarbamoyladenosine biosynthesis protein TsaB